jgi:Zn-dependent protease
MFRLLGFDVHVRTGFVIFLALIVFLYQDAFGMWLAGGIAVFTLIHELGHAVAARSSGAQAEISLDFLAGYTSYRPDPQRPLTPARQVLISGAGPAVHITVSCAVLFAMGANPFSLQGVGQSDATAALWWAGPAIGALNLIPVLPLDGGHIVLTGVETVAGNKGLRYMTIASIVATAGGAVYMFGSGRGGFAIFIAFLLINQLQILQSTSTKRGKAHAPNRAADAETVAWQTGRPGILEPGQRLSPWYEAHRAVLAGDVDRAVKPIVDDLASTTPGRWAPPRGASGPQLKEIVDLLPADLPSGNAQSARIAVEIMLAVGDYRKGGDYAATAFGHHRTSALALSVARASAATGDPTNAVAWLGAAEDAAQNEPDGYLNLLGQAIDGAPEFAQLRATPGFGTLRARFPA